MGTRLYTEVTAPDRGGLDTQSIFSTGRFYFGGLTTGNYIVYLQGGGFDGEKNPNHRLPFDIVDDSPVPPEALLLSGGTLAVYGTSSATTLSYVTNLNSTPTGLTAINAGEGVKLDGIEESAQVNSVRPIWIQTPTGNTTEYTTYTTNLTSWAPIPRSRFSYIRGRGNAVELKFAVPGFNDELVPTDAGQIKMELMHQSLTGTVLFTAISAEFKNNSVEIITGTTGAINDAGYPEGYIFNGQLYYKRIDYGGTGVITIWGGNIYEQR